MENIELPTNRVLNPNWRVLYKYKLTKTYKYGLFVIFHTAVSSLYTIYQWNKINREHIHTSLSYVRIQYSLGL